jgi:AraC-like DNA-binding protein/ligand-binding sensor protein
MLKLVKFIFQQDVQRIFHCFTQLFGIRIVFFSYDGQELKSGDNRQRCRFCSLLRDRLGFDAKCRTMDRKKQLLAAGKRKLVTYQCHGKMTEAIMPVYTVDRLIGFIMIGQFRTYKKFVPPVWLRRSQNSHALRQLKQAYYETPYYTKDVTKNILELFSVLVDFIITRHLISIKNSHTLDKLISYLNEHPEEMLSVAEAAEQIGWSASSLSHRFKEMTGKSFKQYQIALKLDTAEWYFRSSPELTIAQIAHRLGFDDPLYFSRLYKKHRGIAITHQKHLYDQRQSKFLM